MKGDIIIIEEQHKKVAKEIVEDIFDEIVNKQRRFVITVAGESGSGKSETANAIASELIVHNVKSVVLGQDDYFVLPPKSNDAKRRENSEWLGPHIEVRLDLLEQNLIQIVKGKNKIIKPLVDYEQNIIEEEEINLDGIKVVVAEGTYTTLLKNVDCKIFIAKNRIDTLEHRKKRNRGNEIGDSFIEQILETEHKIISGHKYLADYLITKNYEIIRISNEVKK